MTHSTQSDYVPRRSDAVHYWLKRMRDRSDRDHPAWTACDWLVGEYERRADAGVTLDAKDDRAS